MCRSSNTSDLFRTYDLLTLPFTRSTVWRKLKSGLQYWGSAWQPRETQRVQCRHTQFGRGDYSLRISDVREEDGGDYSCTVDRRRFKITLRIMKGTKTNETWLSSNNSSCNNPSKFRKRSGCALNVYRSASSTVTVSPAVAVLDNDFSVSCRVTPWPSEARVQWKLNHKALLLRPRLDNADAARTASVVGGRLTDRLAGRWTCAVNHQGKEWEASATLTIEGELSLEDVEGSICCLRLPSGDVLLMFSLGPSGIVQPWNDGTRVYASVGSAVTLPCVFSASLRPSDTVWEKEENGSVFEAAPRRLLPATPSQASTDKSATLTEVWPEDGGKYRCSGTVKSYRLTRNVQLVVAKSELP